jgi:hypothetical protein
MNYKVFIQTNEKQYLGALMAKYTIERYSEHNDKFSVEIMQAHDISDLNRLYNTKILKDGKEVDYGNEDLQSFTLTRFMPPELMNFEGRSIVIDPDIFSTYSDIWELFTMDMGENAALMRKHNGKDWGTSVMLLDNSKLKHWKIKDIVNELITKKVDYRDWMSLRLGREKIGLLDEVWNHFDKLTPDTKLIHNTNRITQPWRTGLKIEYTPKKMRPFMGIIPREWIHILLGRNPYIHREHPEKAQIDYFFGHLKKAMEDGVIDTDLVLNEIKQKHIRQDAVEVLENTKAI